MSARIIKAVSHQNGAIVCLARVLDDAGAIITTADLVTVKVFDASTQEQIGSTLTPDPADVIFAALVTDDANRWTVDRTGYSFAVVISGDYFPTANTTYQIEVTINVEDSEPLPITYQTQTLPRFGS